MSFQAGREPFREPLEELDGPELVQLRETALRGRGAVRGIAREIERANPVAHMTCLKLMELYDELDKNLEATMDFVRPESIWEQRRR